MCVYERERERGRQKIKKLYCVGASSHASGAQREQQLRGADDASGYPSPTIVFLQPTVLTRYGVTHMALSRRGHAC